VTINGGLNTLQVQFHQPKRGDFTINIWEFSIKHGDHIPKSELKHQTYGFQENGNGFPTPRVLNGEMLLNRPALVLLRELREICQVIEYSGA
jgi:hypothetical protein